MPHATDLSLATATELVTLFRTRNASPVEATRAVLDRIDRHNSTVNAYCLVAADEAMESARRSEARYAVGQPLGLLDGVPVAVKDVFLTRGWPTLRGSTLIDPRQPWPEDAPVVAALRRHGAVLTGKTTTPDLGWKGVTDSPLTGITRNPWDPTKTPGGSSGGSSAAIPLGMATLALGTDGGGSIRIPAAFCGVVGIKPTYGRVPHWPASPYDTLAHAGPMGWTVSDVALMLTVLVEPDPRDWTALPYHAVDYFDGLDGGVAGMRVAFSPALGYARVDPAIAEAVEAAAAVFEELGAHVEQADPGFEDPLDLFETLWNAGAARATAAYREEQVAGLDPGLVRAIEHGRSLSAVEYVEAIMARRDLGTLMNRFHQRYDLLLTPSLPIAAFDAGRDVPEGWHDERWATWAPFCYPFNLTQQPAVSVPCGFTGAGLPIGLQIVAPKYRDDLALRAAYAYQAARPLTDRRPALLSE